MSRNESESDLYGGRYNASVDSHVSGIEYSVETAGIRSSDLNHRGSQEPYPAWTADRQIPMSTESVLSLFSTQMIPLFF